MRSIKQTWLAMAIGCAAMLVAPFASAGQRHHGRHGGNDAAVGIALVIGAAALIASSSNRHNRYDRYEQGPRYGGGYNAGYSNYGPGYDNLGFSTTVSTGRGYGNGYYPTGYAEDDSSAYYDDGGYQQQSYYGNDDASYSQPFESDYDDANEAVCDDAEQYSTGYGYSP